MKKLFIHVRTALAKAGTPVVQFWLIKTLLQNRLNGNDGVFVNSSLLAFVSSIQLYRISTMNGYSRKEGMLFM